MDRNTFLPYSVLLFSISAIPVYMSSRVVRRPVGPVNRQHKHISRVIANINIKPKTDPTYMMTFLPGLISCSGVWFVHFILS